MTGQRTSVFHTFGYIVVFIVSLLICFYVVSPFFIEFMNWFGRIFVPERLGGGSYIDDLGVLNEVIRACLFVVLSYSISSQISRHFFPDALSWADALLFFNNIRSIKLKFRKTVSGEDRMQHVRLPSYVKHSAGYTALYLVSIITLVLLGYRSYVTGRAGLPLQFGTMLGFGGAATTQQAGPPAITPTPAALPVSSGAPVILSPTSIPRKHIITKASIVKEVKKSPMAVPAPIITLCRVKDGIQPQTFPYLRPMHQQMLFVGGGGGIPKAIEVDAYQLTAVGADFVIKDLAATDSTGAVVPFFSGLTNNQVIPAGQTVSFQLMCPPTHDKWVELKYHFRAGSSNTFTYLVRVNTQ